jgi:cytochrome c nitrite reductase small subunit
MREGARKSPPRSHLTLRPWAPFPDRCASFRSLSLMRPGAAIGSDSERSPCPAPSRFTFGYGKGASYLSNDPQACVNCHVMQGHYDSWQNSSHRHVAVCNDCHLPHPVGKWITKADNGFFHSLAFTLDELSRADPDQGTQPAGDAERLPPLPRETVHQMFPTSSRRRDALCVHCHSDVGHASVEPPSPRPMSSTPPPASRPPPLPPRRAPDRRPLLLPAGSWWWPW